MQAPRSQISSVAQRRPHEPQLLMSLSTSRQTPLQFLSGAVHETAQALATQA